MNWNNYDSELGSELREERNTVQDLYHGARQVIIKLNKQIAAQRKYIEELEKQLEPGVIAEIREALSTEEQE